MCKSLFLFFAIALSLAATCVNVHARWPVKVFAPYMYAGSGDRFQLTHCDDMTGQKFFTLAFIIAGQSNNPAWYGRIPMADNFYTNQIGAIRNRGGDVIVSFGGEGGQELALVETNLVALAAKYQSVIDRYKFTWLDFDIEGKALSNASANQRRNAVLARLQKKNSGLIISYTLPVDPDGISEESQALLTDAVKKGVKVHSANLMVMFFGKKFVGKGKSEGELGIESAVKAHEQLQKIDPAIQVGLCPCLGKNGSNDEIFTEADANKLKDWAGTQKWICSLSFWSVNRDAGNKPGKRASNTNSEIIQKPWAFTDIFKSFTTQ
jgi:chitinase